MIRLPYCGSAQVVLPLYFFATNASSNGGDASRGHFQQPRSASGIKAKAHTLNKGSQTAPITRQSVVFALNPDARRVAPISACVWCLSPFEFIGL